MDQLLAARLSHPAPRLVAVTMLTCPGEETLGEIGLSDGVAKQVRRLAAPAQEAALDGVVASPREIPLIRKRCGTSFVIVTPGVRSSGAGDPGVNDDQNRTMSASEALTGGATHLVGGRPIISAPDPCAAAERIADGCRAAEGS